jgi:hypothetical protein
MPPLPLRRARAILPLIPALLAAICRIHTAAAQLITTDQAGVDYVRPAPCWTTQMEFHDPVAFPYFEAL